MYLRVDLVAVRKNRQLTHTQAAFTTSTETVT